MKDKRLKQTNRHSMKLKMLLPALGLLVGAQALTGEAQGAEQKPSASPLPVLLVIANRDFYYQEYANTRYSLEAAQLTVKVAATTATRAVPSPKTGQPAGTDGSLMPDLALRNVNAGDYSAIVFVGGWGSSMYQYAYNDPNLDGAIDSYYAVPRYNGDDNLSDGKIAETKVVVNELINDFLAADKPVAGLCHGVTVLAWARVDGASPLKGKKVASSPTGSPAANFLGTWYADNELSVHEQVAMNGGYTNPYSGQFGDPTTTADDVIVDGRIITAENYESARQLGGVLARRLSGNGGDDILIGGSTTFE